VGGVARPAYHAAPMPGLRKKELMALRGQLLDFALEMPEAYLDHPWGEDVAKVNGKVFVFLSNGAPAALMLPCAEPAGYGLGRSGWVSLRHDRAELPPPPVLEDWIEESYRKVAPRKLVAALEAGRADGAAPTG
jgi:predicted DNA-binding protein (MmcQ/YjbR family)